MENRIVLVFLVGAILFSFIKTCRQTTLTEAETMVSELLKEQAKNEDKILSLTKENIKLDSLNQVLSDKLEMMSYELEQAHSLPEEEQP